MSQFNSILTYRISQKRINLYDKLPSKGFTSFFWNCFVHRIDPVTLETIGTDDMNIGLWVRTHVCLWARKYALMCVWAYLRVVYNEARGAISSVWQLSTYDSYHVSLSYPHQHVHEQVLRQVSQYVWDFSRTLSPPSTTPSSVPSPRPTLRSILLEMLWSVGPATQC